MPSDKLSERVRGEAAETGDVIYRAVFWTRLADEIAALERENAALREWKDAIDAAAVVNWTLDSKHTPREAVNALLAWQSQVALDPRVSQEAATLHAELAAARADSERLDWLDLPDRPSLHWGKKEGGVRAAIDAARALTRPQEMERDEAK